MEALFVVGGSSLFEESFLVPLVSDDSSGPSTALISTFFSLLSSPAKERTASFEACKRDSTVDFSFNVFWIDSRVKFSNLGDSNLSATSIGYPSVSLRMSSSVNSFSANNLNSEIPYRLNLRATY